MHIASGLPFPRSLQGPGLGRDDWCRSSRAGNWLTSLFPKRMPPNAPDSPGVTYEGTVHI